MKKRPDGEEDRLDLVFKVQELEDRIAAMKRDARSAAADIVLAIKQAVHAKSGYVLDELLLEEIDEDLANIEAAILGERKQ